MSMRIANYIRSVGVYGCVYSDRLAIDPTELAYVQDLGLMVKSSQAGLSMVLQSHLPSRSASNVDMRSRKLAPRIASSFSAGFAMVSKHLRVDDRLHLQSLRCGH